MKKIDGYKPECCSLCFASYIFETENEALEHEADCDSNVANKTCLTCRYFRQIQTNRSECLVNSFNIERNLRPKRNCPNWKQYIKIPEEAEREIWENANGNMWKIGGLENEYYIKVELKERKEKTSERA